MSASYFLSPHVHVCVAGKQVVLLDLVRDKYLSIAGDQPLARWVKGWPAPISEPELSLSQEDESAAVAGPENGLLAKMISQGLLVTDPVVGKEAAPVVAEQPKAALVEFELNVRPRTTLAQLWNLFNAFTAAKWAVKHRPIQEVVQAAGRLRKRSMRSQSTVDVATVRPLVTAFLYLRPLFYTSKQACLLDSLTLVRFLARYGVFPQWVFGVKTDPFYAHCWVQQGDFVFNDTADYVRGFSPILVV